MAKNHLAIFSVLVLCLLSLTSFAQNNTKQHTERFTINEGADVHINTSHTNVTIETWDKNEIEVTFTMEAEENLEEAFANWKFEATGNSSKVNVNSKTNFNFDFDMSNFNFDFNMEPFEVDMKDFQFDMEDFQFDMPDFDFEGLSNLEHYEDFPESPFGKDINFDGDEYEENPDAYLKELNAKYNTNVTRAEADKWVADLNTWADEFSSKFKFDEETQKEIEELTERALEQSKQMQEQAQKWQEANAEQLKKMTEQLDAMDFSQFQQFNYFDQDRSNTKKRIHIKLPKNAKLHLNIRYGEVTLAENLRNINADLNYASLSAKTINGKDTDISAAYAPIFVNHWQNGQLKLNHCRDITIKKITNINLHAQGTDILIGTLLNSGEIHNAYGDLEIKQLGSNLKQLDLMLDFGSAMLYLLPESLDFTYRGNKKSDFVLPQSFKVVSDTNKGSKRLIEAYLQKQNSGRQVLVRSNYGELVVK